MSRFFLNICAFVSFVANAKPVNIEISTSCGVSYHVSEIGDNVTAKDMIKFAQYIDWAYCG